MQGSNENIKEIIGIMSILDYLALIQICITQKFYVVIKFVLPVIIPLVLGYLYINDLYDNILISVLTPTSHLFLLFLLSGIILSLCVTCDTNTQSLIYLLLIS